MRGGPAMTGADIQNISDFQIRHRDHRVVLVGNCRDFLQTIVQDTNSVVILYLDDILGL